jgi:hypothetical protein
MDRRKKLPARGSPLRITELKEEAAVATINTATRMVAKEGAFVGMRLATKAV